MKCPVCQKNMTHRQEGEFIRYICPSSEHAPQFIRIADRIAELEEAIERLEKRLVFAEPCR